MKRQTVYIALFGVGCFSVAIGAALWTGGGADLPPPAPEPMAPRTERPSPGGATKDGDVERLRGSVLSTIDVERYTYLQLQTGEREVWVAVPRVEALAKGTAVQVLEPMRMSNFYSKTLNRSFEEIYFGTLAKAPGVATRRTEITTAPAASSSAGAARDGGEESFSVAEMIGSAAHHAGETVRVRGVVVKRNDQIMNRNWVHLRDEADGARGDAELVVTTNAEPELDSAVIMEGVVGLDRDFGSGYRFDVILESAIVVNLTDAEPSMPSPP